MSTRDTDPPALTAAERRALIKLGVLKVEWGPYGSHFVLGNENLRLADIRRAIAALRKLIGPMLKDRLPEKIGFEFKGAEGEPFDLKVQLPGGGSHSDRTFDDDLQALLEEYLEPKLTGVANPSIEVIREEPSGKFRGLMAHVLVVRGEPKTLDKALMLAVPGVKRVIVQEKTSTGREIILVRLDTRDRAEARSTTRALCAAIGLEVVGDDIMWKDPHPEQELFDGDED